MNLLDTLRQLVAKKRAPKELAIKVQKTYEEQQRREIRGWQEARSQWADPTYPHTYPLQLVYKDALLDLHLHAAMQNRSLPFGEPAHTLLAELQYNVGIFEALKNHVQMRDLVRQLRDERGRLCSFREFGG